MKINSNARGLYSNFAKELGSLIQKTVDIRVDNPSKCVFHVTLTSLNEGELVEIPDLPGSISRAYSLERKVIKFSSITEKSLNLVDAKQSSAASDFYTKMKESIQQLIYLPPLESRAFELLFTGCV